MNYFRRLIMSNKLIELAVYAMISGAIILFVIIAMIIRFDVGAMLAFILGITIIVPCFLKEVMCLYEWLHEVKEDN
jgi:uncharacterized membrane protein